MAKPIKKNDSTEKLLLGWNVGGTQCSAIVGSSTGRVVERRSWPSNVSKGPEQMVKDFLNQSSFLRDKFPALSASGVSIGGPLDPKTGVIYSPPNLPGWDNIPLRELLSEALRLPVSIEHDAVACLLAEWLWGAAKGCTHAVYFTAGTGFGAGIMIDGRIVRGPSGQTSEVGHIRLAEDGPCAYGKHGCVESFCSGAGITLLAKKMFPQEFSGTLDTKILSQKCIEGSSNARKVLSAAAAWTGRVCAILADIFAPQVIIPGSMARYLPSWWMAEVRKELFREALPHNCSHIQIVAPRLGDLVQDMSSISPCLFPYHE